jgi:hypothetical protein
VVLEPRVVPPPADGRLERERAARQHVPRAARHEDDVVDLLQHVRQHHRSRPRAGDGRAFLEEAVPARFLERDELGARLPHGARDAVLLHQEAARALEPVLPEADELHAGHVADDDALGAALEQQLDDRATATGSVVAGYALPEFRGDFDEDGVAAGEPREVVRDRRRLADGFRHGSRGQRRRGTPARGDRRDAPGRVRQRRMLFGRRFGARESRRYVRGGGRAGGQELASRHLYPAMDVHAADIACRARERYWQRRQVAELLGVHLRLRTAVMRSPAMSNATTVYGREPR